MNFYLLPCTLVTHKRLNSASASVAAANANTDARMIEITDACAKRLNFLRNKRADDGLVLRVAVSSGGCSGFQYEFEFTNEADITDSDDRLLIHNKAKFVIDKTSLKFLKGAKLDFVEDLIQRSFVILDNPNIVSECGCNVSFSPTPELLDADSDDDDDDDGK
jgi:iron-sulfur cluster insertion protein